jgi:HD-GYP domain-containing protein (c-di-GMP phosphodiesterase class II)
MTARILCVADVYEALTAERPYRAAMPWEESSRILAQGRGTEFDPAVLDALTACRMSVADMRMLTPLAAA